MVEKYTRAHDGRRPSGRDERGLRRRVVWTDRTERCGLCGGEFRLDEPHYYADRRGDTRLLLCSLGCVESHEGS